MRNNPFSTFAVHKAHYECQHTLESPSPAIPIHSEESQRVEHFDKYAIAADLDDSDTYITESLYPNLNLGLPLSLPLNKSLNEARPRSLMLPAFT
jgi:hypothetical protein